MLLLITCNNDSFDVNKRPILQDGSDVSSIVTGNEDASRSRVVKAVLDTSLADGQRVNHRQKIRNIFSDGAIK